MSKTGWIVFVVVVLGLLGGLVAWTRISNPPIDIGSVNINSVIGGSAQNGNIADHAKGRADGKIMLVEYGDFQCPSCSRANDGVNTLMEEYSDTVTFVFRNFPLTSIHPNSLAASAAAESAGLQGKYWEMHDLLYDKQSEWSSLDASKRGDVFAGYASSLGLNTDTFKSDLGASKVSQKISFDQAIGKKLAIDATPTFYLNGSELDKDSANGLVGDDLTAIKAKLDELIKENSAK